MRRDPRAVVLNAANENVLMAVQGCDVERLCPTLGTVTRFTEPRLSTEEVEVLLDNLIRERYLRAERGVLSPVVSYHLTDRGRAEADRVAALGEPGGA